MNSSGDFQPHRIQQLVEGSEDGAVELIELRPSGSGPWLIVVAALENASDQRSIDPFEQLQVNQADLVAVRQQAIAPRVRKFLPQSLGPEFG